MYFASAFLSAAGNSIAAVVWVWLVLDRTGSPAVAATVAGIIAAFQLVVSFIGGSVIDRFGRQRICWISDVVSASSLLWLIAVDHWLGLTVTWFVVIGIYGAVGDIPGTAARQALAGDCARATGMDVGKISGGLQTAAGVALLVGPAAGGLLLAAGTTTGALWITCATSLAAAGVTAALKLPRKENDPAHECAARTDMAAVPGSWAGIRGDVRAWQSVWRIPVIKLLVVTQFVSSALVVPFLMVLIPAHFAQVSSPLSLGVVLSMYAVGFLAGSVAATVWSSVSHRLVWLVCMGLFGLAFVFLGGLSSTPLLLAGNLTAGIGGGLLAPMVMVLVTDNVGEDVRGRAFSLFTAAQSLAQPVGLSVVTPVIATLGIYATARGISGVFIVFGVAASWAGWTLLSRTHPPSPARTDTV
nr:MFS transporter [Corynebacterium mendelii]